MHPLIFSIMKNDIVRVSIKKSPVYTLFKIIVVARNTTKFDATNNISVYLSKFNPKKLI